MSGTSLKRYWEKLNNMSQFPAFLLVLFFFIWNCIFVKGFANGSSMVIFGNLMAPLCLLAIGMTPVVITGGMDLSVGAVVSLVNVIYVTLFMNDFSNLQAILIAISCAVIIGVINGLVVGYLRVPPLLVTFATQSIAQGIAQWVMPVARGSGDRAFIKWYNSGRMLFIPNSLLFLIIPLVLWYLLRKTKFGLQIYAVGRDKQKSYYTGINTAKVQLWAYLICSILAGIAGIAFSGNIGGGDPKSGISMTMNAVASVVIGGVALTGGEGDAMGALLGALFYNELIYTVSGLRVSSLQQDLVQALIILVGVVGMTLYRMRTKKQMLGSKVEVR